MGFTFSLKMVGAKILVPGSWYQDLWGNRSLHDGGTALSAARNRYPFVTPRTPQASLVGEQNMNIIRMNIRHAKTLTRS